MLCQRKYTNCNLNGKLKFTCIIWTHTFLVPVKMLTVGQLHCCSAAISGSLTVKLQSLWLIGCDRAWLSYPAVMPESGPHEFVGVKLRDGKRWTAKRSGHDSWQYLGTIHWSPVSHCHHHHNHFTALFPGPSGWAGARRELLDFMVQGKINRGRQTDHPAGRHSIWTNQCPPPPSPHILYGPDALPAECRPTNNVKALKEYGHQWKQK